MTEKLKKFRDFIGPHPYNPGLMFLFFWAFYLSRYLPLMLAQPPGSERWQAGATILLLALIPAFAFSGCALLWNRFRPWPQDKLRFYLLELFLSTTMLNLTFAFVAEHPKFETVEGLRGTTVPPTPIFMFLNFVFTVLLLAALHQTESKIQNRLAKADALAARLEQESRVLILAEEELKNQVSQFLHDRVQSSLMVLAMRLKELDPHSDESSRAEVNRIITELESLRMQDLRLAIESLSPNLEVTSLATAISKLVHGNADRVKLMLSLESTVDGLPNETKMALYKISEQAILNAQLHGQADQINVTGERRSSNFWVWSISDNGEGLVNGTGKPGLGSTLIDSWSRVIGGTKTIDAPSAGGYTIQIAFTAEGASLATNGLDSQTQ